MMKVRKGFFDIHRLSKLISCLTLTGLTYIPVNCIIVVL